MKEGKKNLQVLFTEDTKDENHILKKNNYKRNISYNWNSPRNIERLAGEQKKSEGNLCEKLCPEEEKINSVKKIQDLKYLTQRLANLNILSEGDRVLLFIFSFFFLTQFFPIG